MLRKNKKNLYEGFDFDEEESDDIVIDKELSKVNTRLNILRNEKTIRDFCSFYEIDDYEITSEGINVNGDVDLSSNNLKSIPWKFNEVKGDFNISFNKISSLRNSPRLVSGDFNCSFNYIKSLEDAPKSIFGKFIGSRQNYGDNQKLSDSFYRNYMYGKTNECFESKAKLIKTGHFGDIISISEDLNTCNMILENGYVIKDIPTEDVELLSV